LVAAIARASNEQTQGIGQVNLAGAQLDTAAQSEELKAHATGLPAAIGQCLAMIGRARTNDPHGGPGVPRAEGNVPSTGPARVGPRQNPPDVDVHQGPRAGACYSDPGSIINRSP
jgi:hypothetical protein